MVSYALNAPNKKPINQGAGTLNTTPMTPGIYGNPLPSANQSSGAAAGATSPALVAMSRTGGQMAGSQGMSTPPNVTARAGSVLNTLAPNAAGASQPRAPLPSNPIVTPAPGSPYAQADANHAAGGAAPGGGGTGTAGTGDTATGGTTSNSGPQVTAATVDTTAADRTYADQMAELEKSRGYMQTLAQNTIGGLQTRNAENAARAGLAGGGASYLSGQRSAAIAGVNQANQMALDWSNRQQGVMGAHGAQQYGAATTNTGNAQQAGLANTGHQWDVDTQKAGAQATYDANQATTYVQNASDAIGKYFDGGANGSVGKNGFNDATAKVTAARTPEEYAAAVQGVEAYKQAVLKLRGEYDALSSDQKKKYYDNKFENYKKKHGAENGVY